MPLQTWTTRPKRPFDSFYYYEKPSLAFVRIRLELGRSGNNPDPGVFTKPNRYVGFVDDTSVFDFKAFDRWTVNHENKIVYRIDEWNSEVLSNIPATGKKVIDFSLATGKANPTFIHHGNPIVAAPFVLPKNSSGEPVTTDMLKVIAENALATGRDSWLGPSTESEAELGNAIFELYEEIVGVLV